MQPCRSSEIDSGDSAQESGTRPVLFLLNGLGIGGSERKTVGIVNDLHRSGWNVHLAYLDDRTQLLDELAPDIPVKYLERTGKLSIRAIMELRNYIVREGIVSVVCVSLYPLIYLKIALGLVSFRKTVSVFLMENATEHASMKANMQMLIYSPLMKSADKVIFGCRAQLKLWIKRYRLDEGKCDVIYNGVDVRKFTPAGDCEQLDFSGANVSCCDSDFIIGAIGSLTNNKNHVELIATLDRLKDKLPNAKLLIAGKGKERERLKSTVESCGLSDRVVLLGAVDDVRPVLKRIDVFVLSSISETFSNAALEAMAMDKVVVLSNTGGAQEMIQDGIDGYIYEQGNIGALADLLERLAADPEKRGHVGRQARKTVIARFSVNRMVSDYQRLLS